jgi:putative nucleotidyltransferase with HDIG domain
VEIARRLGLGGAEIGEIERGALLHDVGKLHVPDAILGKPGPLAPAEWRVMRSHVALGGELLARRGFRAPVVEAVGCHHERWDGRGYPEGRGGVEVPLAARIVAVADTFDAITTDRPYRRARPAAVAVAEIARGSGTQFDPEVVRAFLALHERAA